MKKEYNTFLFILLGSIIYALATVLFIFPHSLLLGGTSGIAVIINAFINFSPGTILMIINLLLLIIAVIVLGKEMAIKSFIGSVFTTLFIGIFEKLFYLNNPIILNIFISSIIGAVLIAFGSSMLFYFNSSSGGTDIVALIIKKYFNRNIGRALLITDILIVVVGGILSGYIIALSSFVGLLIKTLGIDYIIEKNIPQNKQK